MAMYEKAKQMDPYRATAVADERMNRLRTFMEQSGTGGG
jgi:hypothetical protein